MRGEADRRPTAGRSNGSDGFVLIAVLSVMALLALMFGVSSLLARGAIETIGVEEAALREDALLSAGIELAGHQLFALRVPAGEIDGQQVRMNGGTLTIFVAPEAGRVDLNGSDEVLLAAAYHASGLTALDPQAFATQVIAWRGDFGATSFRSVGDLRWAADVGEADIAALTPFFTVFNPSGKLDPRAATRPMLEALPMMTPESVETVLALASTSDLEELFVLRSVFRGFESHVVLGEAARAFAVRIEARLDGGGAVRTVNAVLVAPVTSMRAYHVADWQEG